MAYCRAIQLFLGLTKKDYAMNDQKLFIFDLDGTLIDSLEDLKHSVNYAFETMNIPARTTDDVRRAIGNGALRLIEELLPPQESHRKDEAFNYFLPHYNDHCSEQTIIYDGVIEYLTYLRTKSHIRIALLTNKPELPTKTILQRLELAKFFDRVIGGDTLPKRKPDPDGILYAIEYFSIDRKNTVMIGDSLPDIAAAKTAGVLSVGIKSGYGETDISPDYSISIFADIAHLATLQM